MRIEIRNPRPEDIPGIIRLSRVTYPESWPWGRGQLSSQLRVFPEGQFIAVDLDREDQVVGFASGVIIRAEDYPLLAPWSQITEWGYFENHDPEHGDTLYGAEVMVHPEHQGQGIGKLLYQAREELVRRLNLKRIRAGARISGYRQYLEEQDSNATPEDYVRRVVSGELRDPTLSFQLKRGFRVIAVVPDYFNDPPSLDYAALIEWVAPSNR